MNMQTGAGAGADLRLNFEQQRELAKEVAHYRDLAYARRDDGAEDAAPLTSNRALGPPPAIGSRPIATRPHMPR